MKSDKHNTSLTLNGEEGDRLVIEYDNRGEPYREGATFRFHDGFDHSAISVFLDNCELRSVYDLLDRLLNDKPKVGYAVVNGQTLNVFAPYVTYANICESARIPISESRVQYKAAGGSLLTLERGKNLRIARGVRTEISVEHINDKS